MRHVTQTPTALAERSSIAHPSTYELLGPVRGLRKELGLTSNDVTVLTALISFLPRDWPASEDETSLKLTIVFPSNASLSERANGIDERTLRRSLRRLNAAGLIDRKNSANGKRFPLRYGGIIRDAFGIDLKPMIQNHDALKAKARKQMEERERLRSLRAEALALRTSLLHEQLLDEAQLSSLVIIRNILRRPTLTIDVVLQIIAGLRALGAATAKSYGECQSAITPMAETQEQSNENSNRGHCSEAVTARNGQNVRHIESEKKEIKKIGSRTKQKSDVKNATEPCMKRNPAKMAWEDFSHVYSFFPDAPRTKKALNIILLDIARLLRIRKEKLLRGLKTAGAGKILLILDYLLGKSNTIRQPEAYFETILRS